jgi:hypothetical protein
MNKEAQLNYWDNHKKFVIPEICQLKNTDLVNLYKDSIDWEWDYARPDKLKFNQIALREEIYRRLNKYEDSLIRDREDLAKGIKYRAI